MSTETWPRYVAVLHCHFPISQNLHIYSIQRLITLNCSDDCEHLLTPISLGRICFSTKLIHLSKKTKSKNMTKHSMIALCNSF